MTSDSLGFLSHERGVLRRFRTSGRTTSLLPNSLVTALPTLHELAIPPALGLLETLGAFSLTHFDCFDLELPARMIALDTEPLSQRLDGLAAVLATRTRPLEIRLSDGELELSALAELLRLPNVSLVWVDRARVIDETMQAFDPAGQVPHLRFVETPISAPLSLALAHSGALKGVRRFELKEWTVARPVLETLLRAMPELSHLAIIRSPIGVGVVEGLAASGRLPKLETLDVSGCLLGSGGVSRLLAGIGPNTTTLTLRFNALTTHDLTGLARLPTWPRCEVRLEEVTFGDSAHEALQALATAHRLQLHVAGCQFSVRPAQGL